MNTTTHSPDMSRELAIIANLLLAEGLEFEAEQVDPDTWVLAHHLATGSTISVSESDDGYTVEVYEPGAWTSAVQAEVAVVVESPYQAVQAVKDLEVLS